jgi:hypothetical protein
MNESNTEFKTDLAQAEKQDLAQVSDIENENENTPEFFPVSEGKLITLYILSFGLYGFYWFYKNWQLQQPKMKKKISPVMRATFSIFFTHSLFRRIDERAKGLEQKGTFNANALATLFVGAVIASNLLDRTSMNSGILAGLTSNKVIITSVILFILSTYPLVKAQATVNRINNDILGYLNHKYSIWNYLLMALGIISWLMMAMGLLAQSVGMLPAQ